MAVLRSWEARFGFPAPQRLAGGHRRYGEEDVAALLEVEKARQAGLSLPAAIERVRSGGLQEHRTLHSALRSARPDLQPLVAPVPTMLALSRAIEDEVLARSEPAVLFGSFQRADRYEPVRARWRELARVAAATYVLADFERSREVRAAPAEVAIDREDPVAREWSVVADGARFGAVLAGWELPADGGPRRFECVWSAEPDVVRDATQIVAEIVRGAGVHVELPSELTTPAPPGDPALRAVSRLAHRMVAYVGSA